MTERRGRNAVGEAAVGLAIFEPIVATFGRT